MVICGKAVSVEDDRNYFWYGSVGQGDWSIDPEDTGTDKMIIMESSFSNEDGDYCKYGVVLTKWGGTSGTKPSPPSSPTITRIISCL